MGLAGFFIVRSIRIPVREAVGRLAAASAEILAGTTQQAAGALEQAAAVAQTRDRHLAGLERLAQDFQTTAVEFRQLVEEQDAVVRQADLTWGRGAAAADQARRAGGMVRRAAPARPPQARRPPLTGPRTAGLAG